MRPYSSLVYCALKDLFKGQYSIRRKASRDFERLEVDFREEIADFNQFKDREVKKVDVFSKAINIWNKHWTKAEDFFKKTIPDVIRRQLLFLDKELKLINHSSYLMNQILDEKERERSFILRRHIDEVWREFREDLHEFLGEKSELTSIFFRFGNTIWRRLRKINKNLEEQLELFEKTPSTILYQDRTQIIAKLTREKAWIENTDHFILSKLVRLKGLTEKWISEFEPKIPDLVRELASLPRYYRSENVGSRHRIGEVISFVGHQKFRNSVKPDAVFLSEKPSGYYVPWHGEDYATTYEIYGNLNLLSEIFEAQHLKCKEYQVDPFKAVVIAKGNPITLDKLGTPVPSLLYVCKVIEE